MAEVPVWFVVAALFGVMAGLIELAEILFDYEDTGRKCCFLFVTVFCFIMALYWTLG